MTISRQAHDPMNRMSRTLCAVTAAGCLLILAQGCEKTVQGTSGSKTTEQGMAKAPVTLPGEERVSDDIVVAKAEPETARQRSQALQEMQQEAAATAGAGLQDVFFSFDSWTIADAGKQALGADAQCGHGAAGQS